MSEAVIDKVEPLIAPAVEAQGVELYDLEYLKEGGDWILRLYIDKDGGVDLNDCERVSHAAGAVLDEHDPIKTAYILEVSSPGVERKLKKDAHFERYIGEKVSISLFKPVNGQKKYTGILKGLIDGNVVLEDEQGEQRFDRTLVTLCRLVVFE